MKQWLKILSLVGITFLLTGAVVVKWQFNSTLTSGLTTELNSLANNGYTAASSAITNEIGTSNTDGYTRCTIEGFFTFAAAPTAGTVMGIWFLRAVDGTNYENTPTSAIFNNKPYNVKLPVVSGTSQTVTRVMVDTWCPPRSFKIVLKNDGTGQALTASGHTVKILFYTPQGT